MPTLTPEPDEAASSHSPFTRGGRIARPRVRRRRAAALEVGARYRITLPELADRPLRPHPTTGAVAVPVSSIHRLERSRGVSRAASAVEGAVGGALSGLILGNVVYELGLRAPGFNTRWQSMGTIAAHAGGAGLLTGPLLPSERWKRIASPSP